MDDKTKKTKKPRLTEAFPAPKKTKSRGGPGKPFVKNDPRINRAGRRIGSRNRFSEAFTDAMLVDFEVHGENVIAEVREKDPSTYVRLATALIPSKTEQEIEVKDTSSEAVAEIDWDVITGGANASQIR